MVITDYAVIVGQYRTLCRDHCEDAANRSASLMKQIETLKSQNETVTKTARAKETAQPDKVPQPKQKQLQQIRIRQDMMGTFAAAGSSDY